MQRDDTALPKTIYLRDRNARVVRAWEECLGHSDFEQVFDVAQGDLFDVKAHGLVSPANSFGVMDGGIDAEIRRQLTPAIETRVQEEIQARYAGELPVGCALLVETQSLRWPYLIVAPTMFVPENVAHSRNAYQAFRAALLAVQGHNKSHPAQRIDSLLVPGLATLTGGMAPRRCAVQMRLAYFKLARGLQMRSWVEIQKWDSRILGTY